jgi:hypothetical protein
LKTNLSTDSWSFLKPFGPLLTALVLGLAVWKLPFVPARDELDISLSDILSHAHEHDLQFGPEITSTYGPLGWLYFPYYSAHAGMPKLFAQLVLAMVAMAGSCRVAWRLPPAWRFLFLAFSTWAIVNTLNRADLLVDVALLSWGLLCLLEMGRSLSISLAVLAVFAALAGLAKISCLVIASATVGYISIDLCLRRKGFLAMGLPCAFLAVFVVGWVACGQALLNFKTFFIHAGWTIQSYGDALGMEGHAGLRGRAFVLGGLLLVGLSLRAGLAFEQTSRSLLARRVLLFLWLALLVFSSWKHGFIRLDRFHAPPFFSFCLVFALATEVVSSEASSGLQWSGRGLAFVCVLLAGNLLQSFAPPLLDSLVAPIQEFGTHFSVLLHQREFVAALEREREAVRDSQQLPELRKVIGRDSVDVFGDFQAYAVDNELNYRARPVSQSYNACNRELMALNENWFLSQRHPRFVLFQLAPSDEKFPPMEDALLLRHLLLNYRLASQENELILLESASAETSRITLIEEKVAMLRQKIDVEKYGEVPLWLEVELKPSTYGTIRKVFYASPVVRLAAWSGTNGGSSPITSAANSRIRLIIRRRAPASMLAAGFLASPLVLHTQDVADLISGRAVTRPAAYSVEPAPGQEKLWRPDFICRVYKVENRMP